MLLRSLPDKYTETVNGTERVLRFHTDFSQWMRFEELITDSAVPEDMLMVTALRMIFPEEFPMDISRASMFVLWFYRCGAPIKETSAYRSVLTQSRRAYSYEHDLPYIAAAFMEKYGIDLWESDMHWWKFHALFQGLHDCKFTDICGYRSAEITDDMPEYRRDFIEKMQECYALPVSANELRMIEAQMRFLNG